MSRPEWIEVGRVSRPHGVRGELRVRPDSDNPERFAPGSTLHARSERPGMVGSRPDERIPLIVETVRGDGSFPIVGFQGVLERDAAQALCGYVLEVRSSELPELGEDEYYPFDLVGLEARDTGGRVVGRVTDVVESPAHALLVISDGSAQEIMIPFVSVAVPIVSVGEGFVVVGDDFLGNVPVSR
ncbi:MAG: ribosome maturation factor RimM [bacterium]